MLPELRRFGFRALRITWRRPSAMAGDSGPPWHGGGIGPTRSNITSLRWVTSPVARPSGSLPGVTAWELSTNREATPEHVRTIARGSHAIGRIATIPKPLTAVLQDTAPSLLRISNFPHHPSDRLIISGPRPRIADPQIAPVTQSFTQSPTLTQWFRSSAKAQSGAGGPTRLSSRISSPSASNCARTPYTAD
jgi:hypothetical protein